MKFLLLIMALLTPQLLQARLAYGRLAAQDLIAFAQLTSPLPSEALNVARSRYHVARHHQFIAARLMDWAIKRDEWRVTGDERGMRSAECGVRKNLMISIPYRHGKSEISVRKLVPWLGGKFPAKSGIVITHTDTLAHDLGRDCRDVWDSGGFRTAFPSNDAQLRTDSRAMDRLQTNAGGVWMFTGRGGMGGGFGADWILIDDFFKNAEEARSQATRDHAWHCYISDCQSRLNEESGGICMIGTRKHEDDPQGRILDPTNLHYDPREREKWEVIRLPALAEANDPLERTIDEPLWPERFSQDYWIAQRENKSELVREDFQVQGQCNPTPTEGKYFKKKWLSTYEAKELPRDLKGNYLLKFYGASDHAYRTGQENDRNCLLVAGIDPSDTIWIMSATWWQKAETDEMTEKMIDLMAEYQTLTWYAARDAISGSIRPFLMKRMKERQVYRTVDDDIREDKDLQRRAHSIKNRMAMGMVRFPKFAPWWPEAMTELVTFPNGQHDDLVAALAMLGMALDTMIKPDGLKPSDAPKKGTFAWHSHGQEAKPAKGWT